MRLKIQRIVLQTFSQQKRCFNPLSKMSSFSRTPKRFDLADLKALEDSLSDYDNDEIDVPTETPTKKPVSQGYQEVIDLSSPPPKLQLSPVRPHNRQFLNDFDDDLDISDDDDIRQSYKVPSQGARGFVSNTPHKSPTRLEHPRSVSKNHDSACKKPRLEDLEDIFNEDLIDESQESLPSNNSKQTLPIIPIEISALETSSPSYHRTETLIKRAPAKQEVKNQLLPSSLLKSHSDIGEPLITSTQIDTENQSKRLYPRLDSYNEKHHSKPVMTDKVPTASPTKSDLRRPTHNAETNTTSTNDTAPPVPIIPNFFYATKREAPKPVRLPSPPKKKLEPKDIKPPRRLTVHQLMKRPAQRNSEILLLTQKVSPFDSGVQTRSSSTAAPKTVVAFSLSKEQKRVENLVLQGKSLFYTGSAGTGKSILLKSIIKSLKDKYGTGNGSVVVTASTGLAAVNVGGTTLHSFAGIGLGNDTTQNLIKKIKRTKKAVNRWTSTKVLIIDEVSMISGDLFDKLDQIARNVRKVHDKPFGGIQIVACGDFFQLPPVTKTDEGEVLKFCFDSKAWKDCMEMTVTLKQVFRQKGDLEFIDMLNDMRLGIVTEESFAKFRALERELPEGDTEAAELFSTRNEVERANTFRLRRINAPTHKFHAIDGGYLEDPTQRARLLANFMAPEELELKKGAQVMMIKNMDETLVNGSLGKVVDFLDRDTYLTFEALPTLSESEIEAKRRAIKVKDELYDNLEKQTNVKIPPVEDVEELEDTIFGFLDEVITDDPEVIAANERKKRLVRELHQASRGQKLPLVKFTTPNNTHRYVLVNPETWSVNDEFDREVVSRTQVPLILAWALSIHKSQGQTLAKVKVNLRRIFEKGQAYVAISRAVSREGLQILNFSREKVFAHERVKKFYETLKGIEDYKFDDEEEEQEEEKEMEKEHSIQSAKEVEESTIYDIEDEGAYVDEVDDKLILSNHIHEDFVDASEVPIIGDFDQEYNEIVRQQLEADFCDLSEDIIVDKRRSRKRNRNNANLLQENESKQNGNVYTNQ